VLCDIAIAKDKRRKLPINKTETKISPQRADQESTQSIKRSWACLLHDGLNPPKYVIPLKSKPEKLTMCTVPVKLFHEICLSPSCANRVQSIDAL